MSNKFITFLSQSIQVIEHIGEDNFLKQFSKFINEIGVAPKPILLASEYVAQEYNIETSVLLRNLGDFDRNLSVPKNVFIYICSQYDKSILNAIGYSKQRIYRAKKEIKGLVPNNPEHNRIICKVQEIEEKVKNNLTK